MIEHGMHWNVDTACSRASTNECMVSGVGACTVDQLSVRLNPLLLQDIKYIAST